MKGAIRFRRGVMRQKRTPKMLECTSSSVENCYHMTHKLYGVLRRAKSERRRYFMD